MRTSNGSVQWRQQRRPQQQQQQPLRHWAAAVDVACCRTCSTTTGCCAETCWDWPTRTSCSTSSWTRPSPRCSSTSSLCPWRRSSFGRLLCRSIHCLPSLHRFNFNYITSSLRLTFFNKYYTCLRKPPWSRMWPFRAGMFLKPLPHILHFSGLGSSNL